MYILAQTPIQPFWDSFTEALAGSLGQLVGWIVAALVYMALVYLVWGLPWSRLIAKAGYQGRTSRTLFLMIFAPVLILPWVIERFGEDSGLTAVVTGLAAIGLFGTLFYLAFAPWPVYKELKQLRPKPPTQL